MSKNKLTLTNEEEMLEQQITGWNLANQGCPLEELLSSAAATKEELERIMQKYEFIRPIIEKENIDLNDLDA